MMPDSAGTLLAGLLTVIASSFIASLCLPLLNRLARRISAPQQVYLMMSYGLLPWIVALWVVLALLHPQLAGSLFSEHCHGDICGLHTPHMAAASLGGALLASLISVAALLPVLAAGQRLWSAQKRLHSIERLSQSAPGQPPDAHPGQPYRIIDTPHPLAWSAGLLRPQVYVSSGLLQRLTAAQLQMVLLHEYCHCWRRDNLRKLLLHWATLFWLPPLRRHFRRAYALSTEQLCDAFVQQQGFSQQQLTAVLQQLEGRQPATAQTPAGSHIRLRLSALNSPRPYTVSADAWLLVFILLAGQTALFTHLSHPLLDALYY